MPKDKSTDKKVVSEVVRKIEVMNQPSELKVQTDFNLKDGTYKISTHLTTKQIDTSNPEMKAAVIKQLGDMMTTAVDEAIKKQKAWKKANPEQLEIE